MNMWSLISPVRSQGCQFIQNDKASTNSPSHKNCDGSVLRGGSEVPLITLQHDQWPSDHRRIDRARRQSVLSPSLRNFITLAYLFAPLAHSQLFRSVPPKINRADCGIDPRLSVSIYDPLITLTLTPKLLNCWQGQYCIGNPLDLNQWLNIFVLLPSLCHCFLLNTSFKRYYWKNHSILLNNTKGLLRLLT